MASNPRSVIGTAARYLVYVTVGLVFLEVVDFRTYVPLGSLVIVATGALTIATVFQYVDPDGEPGTDRASTHQPSTQVVAVTMFVLVVAGGFLRVYALGTQSLWFDEAISTNAAIALLQEGEPTFPSGSTYWRAFPHTLAMVASMAVLGTGEAAARAPSVIFGVATIGVTYWLGREVGGRRVGLLAAAFVAFATWEIAWSRQARMYQLFQLLYVLTLVLLLRVERTWFEDRRAVVALVLVGALAAATHQIGYVLLPVAVAYIGLAGFVDGHLSRRGTTGLLVGTLLLVPVIEFGTGGVSYALESGVDPDFSYWDSYVEWLIDELHGVVLLGIVGMAVTYYRGWYRSGTLLVFAVVPPVWILSFQTELFATRYLYFGLPILFVWTAVSVDYVAVVATEQWESFGSRVHRSERPVSRADGGAGATCRTCLVAVCMVGLLMLGGGFTVAPQAEYNLGANAPQPDFGGAYEYVNENRESGDVIVAGWTAPGVYYADGVDYWLAHDLTGTGANWTTNGGERYAGAEPVETTAELDDVMNEHDRGWIVVDEIALARQPTELQSELEAMPSYRSDSVYVFYWG